MTPRVGVLVPPANPTVEPELTGLLQGWAVLHTARLPWLPQLDLRSRLVAYNEALADTLDQFGTLPLSAGLVACTGSSYLLGPAGDRALRERLSASRGSLVGTAAGAVLWALDVLGCRRVTLVSPYPAWLTDLSAGFWTDAGISVTDVVQVPGDGTIYDLSDRRVAAVLAGRDADLDGPLLLAGTGMPTVAALTELAPSRPHPLLSSAVCSAWWLASVLGQSGAGARLPPPVARLAERAAGRAVPR